MPTYINYTTLRMITKMMKLSQRRQILYSFSEIAEYTRRGRHRPQFKMSPGDRLGQFLLEKKEHYRDFEMTHLQFSQQKGCKLHQLECPEQNNTVSFIFKTPNSPKKGLNLALEKLLYCGSKKYPVRDLPMQMSNRSFSKLVPSQSTQDYIMFSFNSPVTKDFENLLNVYTSMLFQPLLRKEDFTEVVRRFTYDNKKLGFAGDLAYQLQGAQFQLDQTIYSLISSELLGFSQSNICKPLDLAYISFQDVENHYKDIITLQNCTIILHGDLNPQLFTQMFAKNCEQFKPNIMIPPIIEASKNQSQNLPKTVNFQHLSQQTILMLSFRIDNPTLQQSTLLQILSYILFDMPQSPFMAYLSSQHPYPPLYGFRQRYFNVGISFQQEKSKEIQGSVQYFRARQKLLIDKQAQLINTLRQATKILNPSMIQRCLLHLQANYYQTKGINIIQSITQRVLQGKSLASAFQVTSMVSRVLKTYKKQKTFENLIKKFLVDNNNYIVLRGNHNPHIVDYENNRNRSLLLQMQTTLGSQKLSQIAKYSSPNILQNTGSLPVTLPSEYQFFEQQTGSEENIGRIKTTFNERIQGNRFIFKFDLTDLGQDDIPILPLFCKAFPEMGYKTMKAESYQGILQNYINKLEMNYQTAQSPDGGLKVYAYLTIQFTDRNHEFAFSVLNGLFVDFHSNNLLALSKSIQKSASQCFNSITDNILHYHGVHLASSQSPFAFFQSSINQARTICAVAADIKKVGNPKSYLIGLSRKFDEIWRKMMGYSRMQVLCQSRKQKKKFYEKYLGMLLKQIQNEGIKPESIDVSTFPTEKWFKYYPNYQTELAFEAFSVPYRTKQSPAALVLASLINHNISTFNQLGGCFLYKGSLVAFIQGNRQKYLELQEHYKRVDDLDIAKRKIFQHFSRYTVEQQFKTGLSFQNARFFKQAVIAVQKSEVEAVLDNYILKRIKEGSSSIIALGQRLQNYEPLMKKGWEIERSIQDLSLQMESLNSQDVHFDYERYIDIC